MSAIGEDGDELAYCPMCGDGLEHDDEAWECMGCDRRWNRTSIDPKDGK